MPNPITAAGWLRGIPHLDSQQIALLEVAMDAYAREREARMRAFLAHKTTCEVRWLIPEAHAHRIGCTYGLDDLLRAKEVGDE